MPLNDVYVEYIIQEHKSKGQSRTHYDFRFGYLQKNALVSYAIPKAKFPAIGESLLSIRTVDHSKDWLDGHDDIISGYGVGSYKTIQRGKMKILGWSNEHITFVINGPEINGKFTLVRSTKIKNDWTLIGLKEKEINDPFAD